MAPDGHTLTAAHGGLGIVWCWPSASHGRGPAPDFGGRDLAGLNIEDSEELVAGFGAWRRRAVRVELKESFGGDVDRVSVRPRVAATRGPRG